jgi:transposase
MSLYLKIIASEGEVHIIGRKRIEIEVNSDQLDRLKRIYRENEGHAVRQRAHAIILLCQEKAKLENVAAILDVCRVTIYNWVKRWKNDGIEGLYDLDGRGRKPLFSESDEIIILSKIKENPSSLRLIVDQVEQATGKKAHIETLRKVARKNGKTWKRKRKIL